MRQTTLTITLTALLLTLALATAQNNTTTIGTTLANQLNATTGCDYQQDLVNNQNGYCWTLNTPTALHKTLAELHITTLNRNTTATPLAPWNATHETSYTIYSRLYIINGDPYALYIVSNAHDTYRSHGALIPLKDKL